MKKFDDDNFDDKFDNKFDDNFEMPDYNYRRRRPSNNSVLCFFLGIVFFFVGVYLITQNTILTMNFSVYSDITGFNTPFGLVLLPLIIGVGILFFDSKNIFGWIVFVIGILIILLGILMGLNIRFKSISLFEGILMFSLTAAGAGLFLRSVLGKNN